MPVVTKYICDGCGKEKGPNNHWFRYNQTKPSIWLGTWDSSRDVEDELLCGEACVLKSLSAWMQERKEQDTETGKG